MKMLVVDDSKPVRTLLSLFARELSFTTVEAADGREALDTLIQTDPKEPFAVALVDWDMPRMNGLDLVQTVRRNRDFDSLKMMMITTQNSLDKIATALGAGADDYLMKPVTKEMLEEKLQVLGVV
jgi:two-component system, chemotaxis family, chemotaxis protein CheY